MPEGQLLTKTRLIRAAGLRWPIEEDFEFGKDCFGLDQCQARLYTAIARHAVLVMAALAICAITTALLRDRTDTQAPPPVRPDQPPPAEPGMIPLTIPEIKRLLAALTTRPPAPVACHPLGRMDSPPPGPLPMVPQTRQTHPRRRAFPGQLVKCGCPTRQQTHQYSPSRAACQSAPIRWGLWRLQQRRELGAPWRTALTMLSLVRANQKAESGGSGIGFSRREQASWALV